LKRRFPGYAARVAKGEECWICAAIPGAKGTTVRVKKMRQTRIQSPVLIQS
jgi:hypothetical protein